MQKLNISSLKLFALERQPTQVGRGGGCATGVSALRGAWMEVRETNKLDEKFCKFWKRWENLKKKGVSV